MANIIFVFILFFLIFFFLQWLTSPTLSLSLLLLRASRMGFQEYFSLRAGFLNN